MTASLTALRKSAGLSQRRLAERVDRDPSQISKWEGGRVTPSLQSAEALSRALNTELGVLVALLIRDRARAAERAQ